MDREERFTPEEATKAIFGPDSYEIVESYDADTNEPSICCKFHGLALQFFNCLLHEIVRDEKTFRLRLDLEQIPNPLNTLSKYEARFTRFGFYSWWLANPHGLPCPEWFKDLAKLDDISVGQLPPSFDEVERRRERKIIESEVKRSCFDAIASTLAEKGILREQLKKMATTQKFELRAEAPNDQTIIDDLTVADVRAMCAHSAPLKSILIAAAKWHKIPNGNQQKRDDIALESCLNVQAKTDGWGTSQERGVAKDELPVLVRYITGNVKGRGRK